MLMENVGKYMKKESLSYVFDRVQNSKNNLIKNFFTLTQHIFP